MEQHYDLVVIGSGPGGEGAAMKATKSGLSVAVVERYNDVGGGCTHWGTIPSKALRHTVSQLAEFRNNPLFLPLLMNDDPIPLAGMLRSAESVVRRQVAMRHGFYERNRVRVVHGSARFVEPNVVEVEAPVQGELFGSEVAG